MWLPNAPTGLRAIWLHPFSDGNPVTAAGVESILNEFGIKYFIVDSHLVTHGRPLGAYKQLLTAEENEGPRGETWARPAYLVGGAVYVRDAACGMQFWSGEHGPATPHTLNSITAAGFDTGATGPNKDLGTKQPYQTGIALRKWHRDRRGISSGLSSGPPGRQHAARRTMRSCCVTGGTKGPRWFKECYRRRCRPEKRLLSLKISHTSGAA